MLMQFDPGLEYKPNRGETGGNVGGVVGGGVGGVVGGGNGVGTGGGNSKDDPS